MKKLCSSTLDSEVSIQDNDKELHTGENKSEHSDLSDNLLSELKWT